MIMRQLELPRQQEEICNQTEEIMEGIIAVDLNEALNITLLK